MQDNKDFLFYANSNIEDVLKKFETSEQGLSEQQAKKRLATYGRNELQDTTITWFDVLKNQQDQQKYTNYFGLRDFYSLIKGVSN